MNPWDQQDHESPAAYRAARIYFEAGATRTLVEVTRKIAGRRRGNEQATDRQRPDCKASNGSVNRWSSKWRWVERAKAYDAHLDQAGDQARVAESLDRNQRGTKEGPRRRLVP